MRPVSRAVPPVPLVAPVPVRATRAGRPNARAPARLGGEAEESGDPGGLRRSNISQGCHVGWHGMGVVPTCLVVWRERSNTN